MSNSTNDKTPDAIVTELRAQIEANEKAVAKGVQKWLRAAEVAIPAVLRAGAAGNVTCKEAATELLRILK